MESNNSKNIKDMPYVDPESKKKYGMKWHRFLCVVLCITAILEIVAGVMCILGKGEYSELYSMGLESGVFTSVKLVVCIVGALRILSGPLAFVARQKLAKFKKNGPLFFYIYLIVSGAASIVYDSVAIIIFRRINMEFPAGFFSVKEGVVGIIAGVVYILLNMLYYHNRKVYFVNGRPEDN